MGSPTWADVMQSPYLQDLPFKVGFNRWGRVETSPTRSRHGLLQAELCSELGERRGSKVPVECSVQTSDGVRVADVGWVSDKQLQAFGDATPYPSSPELCVVILSPTNSWLDMHIKTALHVEAGALEVWVVGVDGKRTVMTEP